MSLAKSLEFLSQYAVELEQRIKDLEHEIEKWRQGKYRPRCLNCEDCAVPLSHKGACPLHNDTPGGREG